MNPLSFLHWVAAPVFLAFLTLGGRIQNSTEAPLRLPTPSLNEQTEVIEAARKLAIDYTASLPDFICTQTIRRLHFPKGAKSWAPVDTLILDVGFSQGNERHRLLTINGRATERSVDQIEGAFIGGEFGGTLAKIFRHESVAKFKWDRWINLRGRPAHVFSYRIEHANSEFRLSYDWEGKQGKGVFAATGLVYVDRETGQVMRLTKTEEDIPSDWPITGVSSETDYGFAEVAAQRSLLPLHAEANVIWRDGRRDRNVIEFSTYRKFSTEATITFETQ